LESQFKIVEANLGVQRLLAPPALMAPHDFPNRKRPASFKPRGPFGGL